MGRHGANNRFFARKRRKASKTTRKARQIADMHNAMIQRTDPELIGTIDGKPIYADTVFKGSDDDAGGEGT